MSDEPSQPEHPPLTDTDRTFLRALADIPEDRTTWLVYADWFEDRGDPRAEFLRLVVARGLMSEGDPEVAPTDARLALLRNDLDPQWMAAFDPAPVVFCPTMRPFGACGRVWTELAPTDAPDIRICRECRRPVFYGHTADDAQMIGSAGEAVALSTRTPAEKNPFPPLPPRPPDTDEIEMDLETFLGPDSPGAAPEVAPSAPGRPWWRFW